MPAAIKTPSGNRKTVRLIAVLFLIASGARRSGAQSTEPNPAAVRKIHHQRRVLVSIPHRKLALIEDGAVKKVYPVAVGAAESPSPTGIFQIKIRLEKPTYFHPGKVIPPGPDNPLGTRWIGLTAKGYGIHGTNVETSIGKAASHGCIRMHRHDLEQLFALLKAGDEVEILGDEDATELSQIFGELPGTEDDVPSAPAVAVIAGQ
jgi:lipoprotein-anchoring transpeptidase ErfK/SrfK